MAFTTSFSTGTSFKSSMSSGSASINTNMNSGIATDTSGERILARTKQQWDANPSYIPKQGVILIYTDIHKMKVGDGLAYLVDLPFLDQQVSQTLQSHIQNRSIHITEQERQLWNSKISVIQNIEQQSLVFIK